MLTKTLASLKLKTHQEEGFTLLELLVVIGILAILMGIVIIAINPARQFALANDTNRRAAITQILNAIGQYETENHGTVPGGIPVAPAAAVNIKSAAGGADLCAAIMPKYIPSLPEDPK